MSKHARTNTPTDADLKGNPMIGGSKGTTIAGPGEELDGETTFDGDVENDVNAQGGIDKHDHGSRSAQHPKVTRPSTRR